MAYDYQSKIQLSSRLIGKYGRPVKIQRKSSMPIDPLKPWLGTTDTYTDHAVDAVVYPIDQRHVNNTSVLSGDQIAYVAALGLTITPEIFDLFFDGGLIYNIVSVSNLKPGSSEILYTLTLRK